MILHYNYILWDFDGVIINSDKARVFGFEKVLEKYPKDEVAQLLEYHAQNGGLSRYVKFRYFFEVIRKEQISESRINELAEDFSIIMKELLTSKDLLIQDTVDFIQRYNKEFPMYIVSGSDGNELRFLCEKLGLSQYFKSIQGSPTPKMKLVEDLITNKFIEPSKTCLFGDATNDYDASRVNGIDFFGYNNSSLVSIGKGYINQFSDVQLKS